jgi:hypothetical protein
MDTSIAVKIIFPDLDDAQAHEEAQSLLSEIKQDSELRPHLELEQTTIVRSDKEAMDFGATLIAVLGTPAVIILARAIKAWVERTGVAIQLNNVRIENVRSQDLAAIVQAILASTPPAGTTVPQ